MSCFIIDLYYNLALFFTLGRESTEVSNAEPVISVFLFIFLSIQDFLKFYQ